MQPHDPDLIRRWQQGDATAFPELVRVWQQPVARFLGRLLGRTDLVQDLCQEVFLRVYLAGPRYREEGTFSTWLYQIALNAARDAGRRQRRQPQSLNGQEPAASTDPPETRCAREEQEKAVALAVAELPPPLREVLVLRHYEGMHFEQIGRLLGVPASTLKSRFTAALEWLRVRLRHLGYPDDEDHP